MEISLKTVILAILSALIGALAALAFSPFPQIIEVPASCAATGVLKSLKGLKPLSLKEFAQKEAIKKGLKPNIVQAVIYQESRYNVSAYRHEPHVVPTLIRKKVASSQAEAIPLASSHGLMQIMGYVAASKGVKWQSLYEPTVNIRVGTELLSDCLKRNKQVYRDALKCYNGSYSYADKVLALADKFTNLG